MGLRNKKKIHLRNRIEESKRYFSTDQYQTVLSLAESFLSQGNLLSCSNMLDRLPTKDHLLESLVAKLKGKSVYKTLRQIHEKDDVSPLTKIKGLSSLITHTIIEMEAGRKEYGILLPILLEKQSELIYGL